MKLISTIILSLMLGSQSLPAITTKEILVEAKTKVVELKKELNKAHDSEEQLRSSLSRAKSTVEDTKDLASKLQTDIDKQTSQLNIVTEKANKFEVKYNVAEKKKLQWQISAWGTWILIILGICAKLCIKGFLPW